MLIIKIQNNCTGTKELGNYNYGVYVNNRCIDKGKVENHDRQNDWFELVNLVVMDGVKKRKEKIYKNIEKLCNEGKIK